MDKKGHIGHKRVELELNQGLVIVNLDVFDVGLHSSDAKHVNP